MTMRTEDFESFDGTRLAVHRTGEGPPVILLHGLFSNANMNWIKWGHADRLAAAGYEAIMPDFRVHGESDSPIDPEKYPPDVLVRDVAALIESLGSDDYVLGGFSLGARTTLHAVAHGVLSPSRVIIGGMGVAGVADWNRRSAFFKRVLDDYDTIKPGDPAYLSKQFLKSQGINRTAARMLLDTMSDLDPAKLDKITMPALVVCGVDDDDNGNAQELAECLPDARYVGVPGTHLVSPTKPEMGEAIVTWLEETA